MDVRSVIVVSAMSRTVSEETLESLLTFQARAQSSRAAMAGLRLAVFHVARFGVEFVPTLDVAATRVGCSRSSPVKCNASRTSSAKRANALANW